MGGLGLGLGLVERAGRDEAEQVEHRLGLAWLGLGSGLGLGLGLGLGFGFGLDRLGLAHALAVDEQARHVAANAADERGEGLHLERGAHHDEQVALGEVLRRQPEEALGQLRTRVIGEI